MWTYNQTCQNELYHHGVKGMKWGVRKAQYKERIALRRAAGAVTDKRKEEFLKVADKHRQTADNYNQQINQNKTNKPKLSRGKKVAIGILAGLAVAGTVATIVGIAKHKTNKPKVLSNKNLLTTTLDAIEVVDAKFID